MVKRRASKEERRMHMVVSYGLTSSERQHKKNYPTVRGVCSPRQDHFTNMWPLFPSMPLPYHTRHVSHTWPFSEGI